MGITGERLAEEYDCSPEYMRRRIKQVGSMINVGVRGTFRHFLI
jgi:hypothetical protein